MDIDALAVTAEDRPRRTSGAAIRKARPDARYGQCLDPYDVDMVDQVVRRASAVRASERLPPSLHVGGPDLIPAAGWSTPLTGLLAAALAGTALLFTPLLTEPFMLLKASFVGLVTLTLVGVLLFKAVLQARVVVPGGLLGGLVAAFLLALVAATITSETPLTALVGRFSRYAGLAAYSAYMLLFLVAARVVDRRSARVLVATLLVTSAVATTYGLLQMQGVDPVAWVDDGLPPTFSTMGNVNFAAAWIGLSVPLAVWAALSPGVRLGLRLCAGGLAVAASVYVLGARSAQGPAVVILGTALVLAVWLVDIRRRVRRPRLLLIAPLAAAVAGVILLVTTGLGAHVRSELRWGLEERLYFYRAALRVFLEHPLTGGGLNGFANHFTRLRDAEYALGYGYAGTDSVHSVPLGMLAEGGLLLATTYASLVLFVGVRLVQGLRRRSADDDRLLLGSLGAVWLGYHLQAAISIDLPHLAVLHWVVAGAIVALSGSVDFRPVPLPRVALWSRTPSGELSGRGALAIALSGLLVLLLTWPASRPLRADLAAAEAAHLLEAGALEPALGELRRATELAPWEGIYLNVQTQLLLALNDPRAPATAIEASRRDPGNAHVAVYTAELLAYSGDTAGASRWFDEAMRRDPNNLEVLTKAAEFALASGQPERALAPLEKRVELRPDPGHLLTLAQAYEATGREEDARAAYKRVLALDPGNMAAAEGQRGLTVR